MSATLISSPEAKPSTRSGMSKSLKWFLFALGALVLVSTVRIVTGSNELDSPRALSAAMVAICPILLAALGGLWAERAGVVNIGLEGQMILGTWGAAYFAYYYDPYTALLGGILFGLLGGLVHAIATVTFGVNHIVSGVAINLMAAGLAIFLAETFFVDLDSEYGKGGPNKLQGLTTPAEFTVPGLSDAFNTLADKHWFLVSDIASVLASLTTNLSVVTVLVIVLFVATAWILWRTTFGLRLRSCGENPQAAESLGVHVIRHKYAAVLVSGGFAGLGGAYLALVASSGYSEGQTNGQGYIGLAAMIFGNWRPGGILAGASMFGYTDSLRLRDATTVHALLLVVVAALVIYAIIQLRAGAQRVGIVMLVSAAIVLTWFLLTDEVPRDFTSMTPYVLTLFVLAFASQKLRMPKADGMVYRKGSVG